MPDEKLLAVDGSFLDPPVNTLLVVVHVGRLNMLAPGFYRGGDHQRYLSIVRGEVLGSISGILSCQNYPIYYLYPISRDF